MALWDDITDIFSGGGRSDMNRGYDRADRYMRPYQQGGQEDYNRLRESNSQWGNDLNRFNHAGDWAYNHAGMSPNDFYGEIMKGYSESPEAKYEQEQAMRGSNAGGAASGMIGSGAQLKELQQNAAGISNRDRDRYYGNVMGANQAQMGYLQNLQGQQAQQRMMQQYLASLGYGAAGSMGQNEINRGNGLAGLDRQTIMDIMSMIGAGSGGAAKAAAMAGG